MRANPLIVAWISNFPVEWLPGLPEELQSLPREHPSSWQRVLLGELENRPELRLHVLVLRKQLERDFTFTRNGVTFHLLKVSGGLRAPTLFWLDTWRIHRQLAEIQPDVVHAWGTERGASSVAGRLKYPYLTTIQGLLTWYGEIAPLNRYHRFASLLERWSLPRSPVVTTESTFAVNFIRQRWPGTNVRQVEHAPDWLFHEVQRRPQTSPVRFLFVGTISKIKGTDLLFTALDRLVNEVNFEMVVVGDPPAAFLEEQRRSTSAGLWSRIQFKKNLRPNEVAAEMAVATILLFPTRADTSPNSVKEAVVAGVPVVASSVGGIVDYVWPRQNGLLFCSGNIEEFVTAIRTTLAHPRFGCGAVEPSALARARDYLSPQRMGEAFMEIYENLASSPLTRSSRH